MPWGRIDDDLYDHPKVLELGAHRLTCMGLYALALSWCNRYLTDGYIPSDRVKKLGGTPALAERLVRVGLWDKVLADDMTVYKVARLPRVQRVECPGPPPCRHMHEIAKRGGSASGEARRLKRDGSTENGSGTLEHPSRPVPSRSHNPLPPVDKSKKDDE